MLLGQTNEVFQKHKYINKIQQRESKKDKT